jgi:hypothetical protein
MNLELWLDDYRLTYQLGDVYDDCFIIRNLPLFLTNLVRAWLEHNWANLIKVFV